MLRLNYNGVCSLSFVLSGFRTNLTSLIITKFRIFHAVGNLVGPCNHCSSSVQPYRVGVVEYFDVVGILIILMEEEVQGMYTNRFDIRQIHMAVFFAAVFCADIAPASTTIISYDFEDPSGVFENEPETVVSGIDALAWFDRHSSLTNFTGNPSSGRALAARTFLEGNTLTLILDVAPGFSTNLDGYSFDHLASASGPVIWDLKVNAIHIAAGNTSTSFSNVNDDLALSDITNRITVELSASGATSNSGTYRVDNFVLTGTVTPVPIAPGIVLFASALAFMPARRKR